MTIAISNNNAMSAIADSLAASNSGDPVELAAIYLQLSQLDRTNTEVSTLIRDMQRNGKLQKLLKDKIAGLKKLAADIANHGSGEGESKGLSAQELALRQYGSALPVDTIRKDFKAAKAVHMGNAEKAWEIIQDRYPEFNTAVSKLYQEYALDNQQYGLDAGGKIQISKGQPLVLDKGHIDAYITKLDGEAQAIGSKNQQLTIFLQHKMQMKEKTMSMVTNIMKASHSASMAVARNLRLG